MVSSQRIAVIGSGISGLSAAWLISKHADVTVYEQNNYAGGHSCTAQVPAPEGDLPVDMGFIVYNELTYPNLTALFDYLDVATNTTDMSLAVSLDNGNLEYGGGRLSQLFAQKRNIIRPRFWSMVRDLVRFYRTAPNDVPALTENGMTLGAYLKANNYGRAFQDDHLLPMAAAIWSMPTSQVLEYPAHAFIRFHDNHGLLKLTDRPLWRTVAGGSKSYVNKLTASFADRIRHNARVVAVSEQTDGICIEDNTGSEEIYNQVVIATHADQALALLTQPTNAERRLLSAFRYSSNDVILHGDMNLMPKRRRTWSSWNYIGDRTPSATQLTVTYWMNSLQKIDSETPYFVTLNPHREIDPPTIYRTEVFEHPIIDTAATEAQRQLWSLQGNRGIWFCGSYFGAGFHEDGLQAGLAVAEAVTGAKRPWQVANESGRIHVGPGTAAPTSAKAAA